MENQKMTLEQFADLINSSEEWEIEFNEIIKFNGWTDLTQDEWNVCSDGSQLVYIDDNGIAKIKSIE